MLEIINRPENPNMTKEQILGTPQIGYNDWGHITIRAIGNDGDKLIVLNNETSARLISFCKRINVTKDAREELPF